jgi:hypothetical protein
VPHPLPVLCARMPEGVSTALFASPWVASGLPVPRCVYTWPILFCARSFILQVQQDDLSELLHNFTIPNRVLRVTEVLRLHAQRCCLVVQCLRIRKLAHALRSLARALLLQALHALSAEHMARDFAWCIGSLRVSKQMGQSSCGSGVGPLLLPLLPEAPALVPVYGMLSLSVTTIAVELFLLPPPSSQAMLLIPRTTRASLNPAFHSLRLALVAESVGDLWHFLPQY